MKGTNISMKVLHINCNYLVTALHQIMVEHLNKRNIENYVFAPIYEDGKIIVEPKDYVYSQKCFNKWDKVWFDLKQKKLFQAIDSHYNLLEFNCIHAYTLFTDGNCAMKLSKKYDKPYIVAVRDTDVNVFFRYMFHLRKRGCEIMKNASKVIFLSEAYRDEVLTKYVRAEDREIVLEKTVIIPNGIDDFWLNNLNIKKDYLCIENKYKEKKWNIIFVGRICPRKNPLVILDALEILIRKGYQITFTVIGNPEDKQIYEKLQSCKNVICLSPMKKEQLIKYYRENDIFVMASIHETFGLVYAEAMSQGLPVIYTRNQGFDKRFPEGHVGYSVNANDANELACNIESIIKKYTDISKNCIDSVSVFSWDKICELYDNIYSKL